MQPVTHASPPILPSLSSSTPPTARGVLAALPPTRARPREIRIARSFIRLDRSIAAAPPRPAIRAVAPAA